MVVGGAGVTGATGTGVEGAETGLAEGAGATVCMTGELVLTVPATAGGEVLLTGCAALLDPPPPPNPEGTAPPPYGSLAAGLDAVAPLSRGVVAIAPPVDAAAASPPGKGAASGNPAPPPPCDTEVEGNTSSRAPKILASPDDCPRFAVASTLNEVGAG